MKRIALIIITIIMTHSFSFCQADNYQKKGKKYKWEFALQYCTIDKFASSEYNSAGIGNLFLSSNYGIRTNNSFAIGCFLGYDINNDFCLRLKYNLTRNNITEFRDTRKEVIAPATTPFSIINTKIKQNSFQVAPGILWKLIFKRITLGGGFEIPYSSYNNYSWLSSSKSYDGANDTLTFNGQSKATIPGGYAIGVGAIADFNILITKHLFLGTELSYALVFSKIGGTIEQESTTIFPIYPDPITFNSYDASTKDISFFKQRIFFNLIYKF